MHQKRLKIILKVSLTSQSCDKCERNVIFYKFKDLKPQKNIDISMFEHNALYHVYNYAIIK